MPIHFDIIRDGDQFFSRPDGAAKFAIGRLARFHGNLGIANDNFPLGRQFIYKADDFRQGFGFWADFIEPTAICEGRSFLTLNTYDRACFTFGFAQFAAHVPDGDFVIWLRAMLGEPDVNDYFPDLGLDAGRVVKHAASGTLPLETRDTTQPLMDYLNPSLSVVNDEEIVAAAKFIHWTMNHPNTQMLQVKQMMATGHALLKRADTRLGLNDVTADLCCIVMDILHQGRGTFAEMLQAMRANDPYKALLEVGALAQPVRVATLRRELNLRRAAFATKRWNRAQAEFV
jgi:hypothetical protein